MPFTQGEQVSAELCQVPSDKMVSALVNWQGCSGTKLPASFTRQGFLLHCRWWRGAAVLEINKQDPTLSQSFQDFSGYYIDIYPRSTTYHEDGGALIWPVISLSDSWTSSANVCIMSGPYPVKPY